MFAVLGLGEVVARFTGFAATAWIARRLGADEYGVVAVAAAIVLYFSHVADFSVEVLGARALAQTPGSADRLVPPLVAARLVVAVLCIALLSAAGLLFVPQPDGAVLAVTSLTLLAVAGSTRFVFVGGERPAAAAAAKVTGELLALVLAVLLVRGAGDLVHAPLVRVAGDGTAVVLMALVLRRRGLRLPVQAAPDVVRPMFASAAPLVAHAILGLAIFNSDLIFLRALRGAGSAGLYATAYTLISFLLNLSVAYGNSFLPVYTRLGPEPARQRALYDDSMTQLVSVALPTAAGGCLLAAGLMRTVFGTAYVAAAPALQVLIWSVVAAFVRAVVTFALIGHGRQAFVLRTTAWSAAINLALNALLIPRFGLVGAASATLATEVLRTVIGLAYGAKLGLGFGYVRRLWRAVLGTGLMSLVLWLVPVPMVVAAIVLGAAVYGSLLVVTGGIRFDGLKPRLAL